jgi:restriction system protein
VALQRAREAYAVECQQREDQATQSNAQLDALIAGLAAGSPSAIDEYIGIVLSNSVYPECFEVGHDYRFDPELGELSLTAWVPGPETVPTEKEYKYVKTKDQVVATQLSQKAQRDRYAGAVHQVALRTLHEVFEADRQGRIQTLSLTVAAEAPNPATGHNDTVPLVAVAAERESFMALDLSAVVPSATLDHLSAQVSKNPFGLAAIDDSQGVRTR